MKHRPAVDDRVRCEDCVNYRKTRVAATGTIRLRWCVALNTHAFPRDSRVRCQQYRPGENDSDQRDGMARWPSLPID